MAYKNNIYGNAAYSGFFAGMIEGRGIRSATAADYVPFRTAALAQAVSVDALIAFDGLVTTAAAITQLDPATVLEAAISGDVVMAGDGGQTIVTAVAAVTTGNVVAANQMWRAQLLHSICKAAVFGRSTKDATVAAGQTVQAAAIFAAWTTAIAGLVIP